MLLLGFGFSRERQVLWGPLLASRSDVTGGTTSTMQKSLEPHSSSHVTSCLAGLYSLCSSDWYLLLVSGSNVNEQLFLDPLSIALHIYETWEQELRVSKQIKVLQSGG